MIIIQYFATTCAELTVMAEKNFLSRFARSNTLTHNTVHIHIHIVKVVVFRLMIIVYEHLRTTNIHNLNAAAACTRCTIPVLDQHQESVRDTVRQ